VFASLLGVWQSTPYLYADVYGILRRMPPDARAAITQITSVPYRAALCFITVVPLPFACTGCDRCDRCDGCDRCGAVRQLQQVRCTEPVAPQHSPHLCTWL